MSPTPIPGGGNGAEKEVRFRLPAPAGPRRWLRLTNIRLITQAAFFALFVFFCWATWTSRLGGYPVSRILEMDPLVALATALSTGTVYRALGWSMNPHRTKRPTVVRPPITSRIPASFAARSRA